MLYDSCWAIRLIAALLLTFMFHIRAARGRRGFGGLSPPKQCTKPLPNSIMKAINWGILSIFTLSWHQQGNKKLTLTITSRDFHHKRTLTIMSGDFHSKLMINHNVGWFSPRNHVATTPVRVEIPQG